MANNKHIKPFKYKSWVNPIIMAIFSSIRFLVSPLLSWEISITYTIIWFSLFIAVLILLNYFLYFPSYQRWKKSKTAN